MQYSERTRDNIPYGFCHCGCGEKTTICSHTSTRRNLIKGQPANYLTGHGRAGLHIPNVVVRRADTTTLGLVLGDDHIAIIDAEDYPLVSRYRWKLNRRDGRMIANFIKDKGGNVVTTLLHHMFIVPHPGYEVDHRDGDPLNNSRLNLRISTKTQNMQNMKMHKDNVGGFKGASFYIPHSKWRARIHINGKDTFLGYYDTPMEAGLAYDAAARNAFGRFARVNFPIGDEIAA